MSGRHQRRRNYALGEQSDVCTLCLVPIYFGAQQDLLARLAQTLHEVLGLRVQQHPPYFDPELAFDSNREQYNSRILLGQLLADAPDTTRILGVAGVDLFIPVLTYVFGEAQLDGRAAVVSSYRLDNQIYGLPHDPDLLLQRLCKEALHELGHTYNLVHCRHYSCVMTGSTYVEDIDQKSIHFCPECFDVVKRARSRGGGL